MVSLRDDKVWIRLTRILCANPAICGFIDRHSSCLMLHAIYISLYSRALPTRWTCLWRGLMIGDRGPGDGRWIRVLPIRLRGVSLCMRVAVRAILTMRIRAGRLSSVNVDT